MLIASGSAWAQAPSVSPVKPTPAGQPATMPPAVKTGAAPAISPEQMKKLSPEEVAKIQKQIQEKGAGDDIDPTQRFPVDAANPSSQAIFEKATHELGNISDDKEVEFEFAFKNEGTKTLEFLGQPTGSCGCTIPNLEKLVYEPGESGAIKGKYNPNHRNGPQHTQITVRTNDPKKPQLKLHVKSDVRPIFRVDPQFLNVGQVSRDAGANSSFKIISRKEDLKVDQVTPSSPRAKVKIGTTEAKQTADGETVWETPVEVTIDGKAGTGPLNENIVIRSSDAARTISTVVMGEVLGDITMSPNQLSLPGLTPGQAVTSKFQLISRTGSPFRILKVEEVSQGGAQPFMKFDAVEDQGASPPSWTVNISGLAPGTQGALRGEIVATTDNPNDPQMRVRYFGFIRPQQAPQPAAAPKDPWKDNPPMMADPNAK